MKLNELVAYLDAYLEIDRVPDYSSAKNGLQVEGTREIRRVVTAVDACLASIDHLAASDSDLLLVHHGLFWGETCPITGAYYKRLRPLFESGAAVYSAHLPLDVHPEVGNNAVLARKLLLSICGTFGRYQTIDVGLVCDTDMTRDEILSATNNVLGVNAQLITTGPTQLTKVGVLTGGGGSFIKAAHEAGCDMIITGEGSHHTYFEAEELGINVIYAGHYATETVGVQALGNHLADRFGLEARFYDHPTHL